MRAIYFLLLASALMLSGCIQSKYTSAPIVGAYIDKVLPTAKQNSVDRVEVYSGEYEYFVFVKFEDETVYEYQMDTGAPSVKFIYFSTKNQRDTGSYDGKYFQIEGQYLFSWNWAYPRAQVKTTTVVNIPFDDDVKQQLNKAVLAVNDAVARHKKFVPIEKSWGAD